MKLTTEIKENAYAEIEKMIRQYASDTYFLRYANSSMQNKKCKVIVAVPGGEKALELQQKINDIIFNANRNIQVNKLTGKLNIKINIVEALNSDILLSKKQAYAQILCKSDCIYNRCLDSLKKSLVVPIKKVFGGSKEAGRTNTKRNCRT